MLQSILYEDESIQQVVNVAHLPGIQKYSLGMPDIHWGYGFPIGGVAATDLSEGVISPGGVGYDINCGVRLARTDLFSPEIRKHLQNLVINLFNTIPTGVGSSGAIRRLNQNELKRVLNKGAHWAVENGYGESDDVLHTEENGQMDSADPGLVSHRAFERGSKQLGTLGSGNHFLEIDVVDTIYDKDAAKAFGLFFNQIVVLIHTGSRGCGYQICDDFLKILSQSVHKYGIDFRGVLCALPVHHSAGIFQLLLQKQEHLYPRAGPAEQKLNLLQFPHQRAYQSARFMARPDYRYFYLLCDVRKPK